MQYLRSPRCRGGWLAAGLWCLAVPIHAAVTFLDIQFWTGSAPSPTASQAAMVVDWNDGSPPLVWGYRWEASQGGKTSGDMLNAILGADSRFSLQGTSFVSHLAFDADRDGTPERFRPAWNGSQYWAFFVNNAVSYHPTNFLLNTHILPPNGNPYAAVAPGTWVASSTGVQQRPLADGSWDGYVYNEGTSGPAEPIPVSVPIPEAGSCILLLLASGWAVLRRRRGAVITAGAALSAVASASAGPFSGPPSLGSSDAVPADSPSILRWATGVAAVHRGLAQINDASLGFADWGDYDLLTSDPVPPARYTTGPADATTAAPLPVFSLGDGGSITLTFGSPIGNGPGPDFAVFENGFLDTFLELAYVEVSSNGTNFVRFPSISLTPTETQITQSDFFTGIDATEISNLAGKYAAGYGTPFDLDDLVGLPGPVNLNGVTHVRIVDVVGTLLSSHARRDSLGNVINDPWPTPFESSGFDLDAVAVLANAQSWAPHDGWRHRYFTHAQITGETAAWLADGDGDGATNLMELARGTDPRHPDAAPEPLLDVRRHGAGLELVFIRRPEMAGLNLTVESSADGRNPWNAIARSLQGAATLPVGNPSGMQVMESGSGTVEVKVRLSNVTQRGLFRLRIDLL